MKKGQNRDYDWKAPFELTLYKAAEPKMPTTHPVGALNAECDITLPDSKPKGCTACGT